MHPSHAGTHAPESFPTDPTGLPEATPPATIHLSHGDTLDLEPGPVSKHLRDATVRMLAYNGSIPGPTLKVAEGSEVIVHVTNNAGLDTTVHWHGLRLENRYDGVPHETQTPIPVGGDFTYRIRFPDPGLYWYHPHIREDYTQEMGLYGAILVEPADPDYWPPVNSHVVLTLDDILLDETGKIAPFSPTETTYAAMGRYGNLLLIGGETDVALTAKTGEVVRLWLVNTANSRVFNVRLPGARMKLVGGDSGRYEHEQFIDAVVLAPSERAVVDVYADTPGQLTLEHRTPDRSYPLATLTVTAERAQPALRHEFDRLRTSPELAAERDRLDRWLSAPPDKTLALVAEMDDPHAAAHLGPDSYACPMHPEVTSSQPGRCPRCGMKLLATPSPGQGGSGPSAHEHSPAHPGEPDGHPSEHDAHGGHHEHAGSDGIEWEDDMVEVNRLTTPTTMRWNLFEPGTGHTGHAIDWRFTVGDRVKIRLVNEMDSDHPMHHPFHLHGAGRFLVLARDGVPEPNLVWKDTVLIRTGQTVDILFDVTEPGLWMAHCHIAEHMQSGMMFSFTVARLPEPVV